MEPTHLVVGIGASAGGLDAFKAFFSRMPADSGLTFVLVQHLDPDHESSLAAIIAGYTAMAVHLAEERMAIGPNQVYIIPPDAILTISGGILHLARPAPVLARRTSITTFLTSLAEDQGEDAVGIILSGFGSDGALGMGAIKEHGGLTLSQADFDHHAKSGMPQSAASSGFVDHVLAVEDMPDALLNYQHHRTIFDATKGPDGIRLDLPSHLAAVCAVLNARLGRDFSQYKTGTLMRRIQRRMHVLQIEAVPAYIEQLRKLPNEAELLFRELLISVTRFFRDPEAFEELEAKIIPPLLADTTDPIRMWVAGCATGEEAYSLAILLKEGLARCGRPRPIQIFATDIDDRAIEAARTGLYLASIAADLSEERLERNFVKESGCYRVTKDIREMCLFSTHDLVKDPPFSKLDLVSCRNVLIYFDAQLQERVLTTFHYALRPGRHLFLGPSESVTARSRLFAPIDKRRRLYVRQGGAARLPTFSISHSSEREPLAKRSAPASADEVDRGAAHVLAQYTPAFVVVDGQHDILRFSGHTAKYLQPTAGLASLNVFELLHKDLRAAVRTALRQAAASGAVVRHDAINIGAGEPKAGENHERVNLIVEPLPEAAGTDLFLVAFQEAGHIVSGARQAKGAGLRQEDGNAAVRDLNRELLGTRENLRNITEELESANEELRSSNEEYLSTNEELQSANEELETSKEEMQSLNEELQTINSELNNRNASLMRSNSDLANLFDSTSVATVFLDKDLLIRRFTPRFLEIFNVREGDEGRPISDIVTHLTHDELAKDVRQVLRTLAPIEREVAIAEGRTFLMQIRPYRDLDNVIDGAVVTFIDISDRKLHEQARSWLSAIVESSEDAIISHDLEGAITSWNAGAEQLYGYPAAEAIGQSISRLLGGAPDELPTVLTKVRQGERIPHFDSVRVAKGGRWIEVSATVSPVREDDGRIVGASVVARDIGERRAAEEKAALLLGELDHRVKNILAIVSAVVSQTLKSGLTPEAFAAEIDGRVRAIAKAHSLLTQAGQGATLLRAIVETELAPYENEQGKVVITGPDVCMTPKAGLAMAMAVHELASNAAKYGALGAASGRLTVAWEVTDGLDAHALTLAWTESGGPPVGPPARRGFGTTLIERTLSHEFDAEVSREFLPVGLRCKFVIPLTKEVGHTLPASDPQRETDGHR